jgi:hypothetical protein
MGVGGMGEREKERERERGEKDFDSLMQHLLWSKKRIQSNDLSEHQSHMY